MSGDAESLQRRLDATRALLTASTADEVLAVVTTLVHDLGGALVPARLSRPSALPLDVALGEREPVLVDVDPLSVAAMRLQSVLPGFLEDARLVLERVRERSRRTREAEVEPVTGLLPRRAFMRRLAGAQAGDAVALIDLDHFKQVNDTAGHAAGDELLRRVGLSLRRHLRDTDACGRYGGDELSVLAPRLGRAALADRLESVRADVVGGAAGLDVGLSAGVAAVGPAGGRMALAAADRALYRAKAAGRNRTELATPSDEDAS